MNKLKMLVLTALAAATVGVGALAAAPSASATNNDGTVLTNGPCYLKTSFGFTLIPHGTVIWVRDANGNETKYKCNNGIWEKVTASPPPTRTYVGSLSTVVTRV